jgi:hypothetical protein
MLEKEISIHKKIAPTGNNLLHNKQTNFPVAMSPWTTLEEDYIAFLLPAPKSTNCIYKF